MTPAPAPVPVPVAHVSFRNIALRVLLALVVPAAVQATRPNLQAQTRFASSQAAGRGPFARGKPLSTWIAQAGHYIPEMRREAVQAIAFAGPGARDAVPVLIRTVRDANQEVRFWSVVALGKIGPAARDAVPVLILALMDDEREVSLEAKRSLAAIGPRSVDPLRRALASHDPWVRSHAAEALGEIGEAAHKSAGDLARLLADDSLSVRASAAWAVGRIGPRAKKAVGALTDALEEEIRRDPVFSSPASRLLVENLVFALGRMGKHAKRAVRPIGSVLNDGDPHSMVLAAEALGRIGTQAVPVLRNTVGSGSRAVQYQSAVALRMLGSGARKAVPELIGVLEQTDELEGGKPVVIAVAEALGAIGPKARKSLPALSRQLERSGSPDVVAALERAIRKITTRS